MHRDVAGVLASVTFRLDIEFWPGNLAMEIVSGNSPTLWQFEPVLVFFLAARVDALEAISGLLLFPCRRFVRRQSLANHVLARHKFPHFPQKSPKRRRIATNAIRIP